jgi:prepilin-type N-terminal cleavage/methylation domain-containing protein
MSRAFSLLEIMAVVAIAGVMAAVGISSMVPIIEKARRDDQSRAALAQIRKIRAHALTANEGAAIEAAPLAGGGVRIVTAAVPRTSGLPQCQNYESRASFTEERVYDLLDIVIPRTDNTLCFDASAFRLLNEDGLTLAPAPAVINFFEATTTDAVGALTVAPSGSFGSSFEPAVNEGLAATVNVTPLPPPEDLVRNVVEPRTLDAELPVTEPPPRQPTTPQGEPVIEALPRPTKQPPPPPPPSCTQNPDCPVRFYCDVGGTNTCLAAATTCPCSPGYYCDGGKGSCVLQGRCSTDADCDVNSTCVVGQCEFGCNSQLCPRDPVCTGGPDMCQHNGCCVQFGCPCI